MRFCLRYLEGVAGKTVWRLVSGDVTRHVSGGCTFVEVRHMLGVWVAMIGTVGRRLSMC